MWGRKGLDVWAIRGVTAVKRLTGVDLKARARKLRLKKVNDSEGGVDAGRIEDMKKDLLLREGEIRDMFEAVDCFVAPSKFLARQFADYGLDADRLVCSDYGTPVETFEPTPFPAEGPLRIGFLGSIQPVKGVHVLFDAATHLESGSFHLRIYGDAAAKPEYGIDLAALQSGDVEIVGRAHFSSIPEIIPTFDVLVCPSIWWENSPLVIHEAFAAGVPVICSGIGGMAELVEDGVNGFHYTAGDGEDLARKLKILIDDRTQLDRLRQGIPELKDMAEDAEFHEGLFRTVVDQYR